MLRQVQEHRQQVGQRLRDLRKAKNWSQEDAAHAVGVAVKTWSNWERGRTDPYDSNWRKIAEAFDVDPAEVIGTRPGPLGLPGDGNGSIDDREAKVDAAIAKIDEMYDALVRAGIITVKADPAPAAGHQRVLPPLRSTGGHAPEAPEHRTPGQRRKRSVG